MNKNIVIKFVDQSAFLAFMVMALFITTSNAAVEISFGVILLCFVLRAFLKRPTLTDIKDFFSNRINLALLVFFLLMGLSLFAGGNLLGKSFYAWTCKWGEGVLLFYFAQIFLNKKQIKMILTGMMASAFITCLSGFWQIISGSDFLRGYEVMRAHRYIAVRSSFNHYNSFAAFLVTVFFIVYGFFMQAKQRKTAVVLLTLLFMIIVNLVLTYSRGGWLAFLLTAGLSLLFCFRKKECMVMGAFLFFMVFSLMAFSVVRERFFLIFQSGGDASRYRLWTGAWAMFNDSPLIGTGVGLFMDRLREYSKLKAQYAHNNYVQILAETGVLGLGGFLWFIGELVLGAYRRLKSEKDLVFTGVFLSLTAFLIHGFFDVHFYSLRISVLFWMLAGMLSVYSMAHEGGQVVSNQ